MAFNTIRDLVAKSSIIPLLTWLSFEAQISTGMDSIMNRDGYNAFLM